VGEKDSVERVVYLCLDGKGGGESLAGGADFFVWVLSEEKEKEEEKSCLLTERELFVSSGGKVSILGEGGREAFLTLGDNPTLSCPGGGRRGLCRENGSLFLHVGVSCL